MALSYPYPLDFLSKCLLGETVPLGLRRFDERSGSGDGRHWSAQLSTPLWEVSYSLYSHSEQESRAINAKIHALDGMQKTFLYSPPYYKPASTPTSTDIVVSSIRADRGAISFSGSGSWVAEAGDYFTIEYASGRVYFGTFAERGTLSAQREVRPYIPFSVTTGNKVTISKPFFKAIVEEFSPFASMRGAWGQDAAIKILQKI